MGFPSKLLPPLNLCSIEEIMDYLSKRDDLDLVAAYQTRKTGQATVIVGDHYRHMSMIEGLSRDAARHFDKHWEEENEEQTNEED